MTDTREDILRMRYEERSGDCLSGDPYCANNPASRGTYEAWRGSQCSACEEAAEQNEERSEEDA